MKNRTIIGIVCIVFALILAFVIAPLVNRYADGRVDIVRLRQDVTQGHKITEDDIETVTVGGYNLPAEVVTDRAAVVGQFAACDLKRGDYLLPAKLSATADNAADVFATLDGSAVAMSITIPSFAGGLSGKLENGDIVSLIVYTDTDGEGASGIPEALTYVRVITATTAGGLDKDELTRNEDGTYELPTTLTLLVAPVQAKLLAEYENNAQIHAVLVSRGNERQAKKYLREQEDILARLAEEAEAEETEPSFSVIIPDESEDEWDG